MTTKITPEHEAWRNRRAQEYWNSAEHMHKLMPRKMKDTFEAGMTAEHEVARLMGRIEAWREAHDHRALVRSVDFQISAIGQIHEAEAQLAALLAKGEG